MTRTIVHLPTIVQSQQSLDNALGCREPLRFLTLKNKPLACFSKLQNSRHPSACYSLPFFVGLSANTTAKRLSPIATAGNPAPTVAIAPPIYATVSTKFERYKKVNSTQKAYKISSFGKDQE